MRIGWNTVTTGPGAHHVAGRSNIREQVEDVLRAEREGFDTFAVNHGVGHDAIAVLTLAGWETSRIRLLTAVVPNYLRHPVTMAQQAVTAQAASRGRFTLGIGASHAAIIEEMFGMSFEAPARYMREYLAILLPLLSGEPVAHEGAGLTFRGGIFAEDFEPVPCALAAMGPVMLRLAGSQTRGTILWMATAKTIARYIAPRINAAAATSGRERPEIICHLPVALTATPDAAREKADSDFEVYGRLPSYRALLDEAGLSGPGDAAIVGDEATIERALGELEEAGVTLFNVTAYECEPGAIERTRQFFADRFAASADRERPV